MFGVRSAGMQTQWTAEDSERAREAWAAYQQQHDLTGREDVVAAIDPVSGRVWIGASGADVATQMRAEGFHAPVYLVRIGSDYFIRKGRFAAALHD